MMKKSFENCTWSELNRLFGLQRVRTLPDLTTWLGASNSIPTETTRALQKLQDHLANNFMDWNEDELKMQFIAPLLYLVDYTNSPNYHPFSQRLMQMQTEDIELSGIVDWVLASGYQLPEIPYFFLYEYKKEKGGNADPVGQVLAAMLTAQHLNNADRAVFGAFVIGKDWTFMVLKGKEYATSRPYQANESPDLELIFSALTEIKNIFG